MAAVPAVGSGTAVTASSLPGLRPGAGQQGCLSLHVFSLHVLAGLVGGRRQGQGLPGRRRQGGGGGSGVGGSRGDGAGERAVGGDHLDLRVCGTLVADDPCCDRPVRVADRTGEFGAGLGAARRVGDDEERRGVRGAAQDVTWPDLRYWLAPGRGPGGQDTGELANPVQIGGLRRGAVALPGQRKHLLAVTGLRDGHGHAVSKRAVAAPRQREADDRLDHPLLDGVQFTRRSPQRVMGRSAGHGVAADQDGVLQAGANSGGEQLLPGRCQSWLDPVVDLRPGQIAVTGTVRGADPDPDAVPVELDKFARARVGFVVVPPAVGLMPGRVSAVLDQRGEVLGPHASQRESHIAASDWLGAGCGADGGWPGRDADSG